MHHRCISWALVLVFSVLYLELAVCGASFASPPDTENTNSKDVLLPHHLRILTTNCCNGAFFFTELIGHLLSHLGGGKCDEVNTSDLILEPSSIHTDLSASMSEIRKRVAFQLCQCYWRRVRPHLVLESCVSNSPATFIDECVSKISSDEGRMDYWQRFVDVNRFIFQLNAHLLSDVQRHNFALLVQRIAEMSRSQLSSYELAQEEFKLASEMESKTAALLESVDQLSTKISPISDLSERLPMLLKTTSALLTGILAQNKEMEDTATLLLLIVVYVVSYTVIHFSTAICFSGTTVYRWTRRLMIIAMLADWALEPSRNWLHTFIAIISCFPASIGAAIASRAIQHRIKLKRKQEDAHRAQVTEDHWEGVRQWFEALVHRREEDAQKLSVAHMEPINDALEAIEEESCEEVGTIRTQNAVDEKGFKPPSAKSSTKGLTSPKARKRRRTDV